MAAIAPFTDEQARVLVNLEQHYKVWIEAEQSLASLPYDLRRKESAGRNYLYEIHDRSGNGKSLGPWSPEQEAKFKAYHENKSALKTRREESLKTLTETARLCRALRVPMLADAAGPILLEADRRKLLDGYLLVVGTNAMPAYAVEAGGFIRDAPDETQDFDMAWSSTDGERIGEVIWPMLKAVDPTFSINSERTFQARNNKAYEFEILAAPSRAGTMSRLDKPRPVPLPEQEWLLEGRPVDRVVICRNSSPARIVAPDPRWFALQKLWLSRQAKRDALKRPKDLKQGMALLDAVDSAMPQYPLNRDFESSLPEELAGPYKEWQSRRPAR